MKRHVFFSYSPFVVILLELSFRAAMSICVLVLLGRVLFAVFATNNPPSFTNIYIYWTVQLYIIQNDYYFTIVTVYYVRVYVLVWPVLQDRKSVTCIINQWKIGLRTMATFDDRHELVNLTVDQQQKLFILQ